MAKQIVRLISVIDVDVSGLDALHPEELGLEELGLEEPHREALDHLYSLQPHDGAVREIGRIGGFEVVNEVEEIAWIEEDGTFGIDLVRRPKG